MTASPTGSALTDTEMTESIIRLMSLIDGSLYMPIHYEYDFNQAINRPNMELIQTNQNQNEPQLVAKLNEFLNTFLPNLPFLSWVNSRPIDITRDNSLKRLIENKFKESNIEKDPRRYQLTLFIQNVLTSHEISSILGVTRAISYLKEITEEELKKHIKNKLMNQSEINQISNLLNSVKHLNGESEKLSTLIRILKQEIYQTKSNSSRVIIFVRRRKTARMIQEFLSDNEWVKNEWNPEFFTGHGSGDCTDGMEWDADQRPALERFNEGQCRLLVSTNVLQEGLDVSVCDKVIIFDPLYSLTGKY